MSVVKMIPISRHDAAVNVMGLINEEKLSYFTWMCCYSNQ